MITKDLGNKQIMADNLRRYIDSRGMNIKEFAGDLDFKYTTVLDWVNAKTYPRIDKIEMIANYFNIEKSDLVERKIEKTTKEPQFSRELLDAIDNAEVYSGKPIDEHDKEIIKNLLAGYFAGKIINKEYI